MSNPRKAQIGVKPLPNCDVCRGKGFRMFDSDHGQKIAPCDCWVQSAVALNIQLTWPYMAHQAKPVADTPLLDLACRKKFAFITATQGNLASHLKGCMISYGFIHDEPYWWVVVTNDKDIVDAWLHTAKLAKDEIFDADVASRVLKTDDARSIKDLAVSADHMIIQMGKKVAKNRETGNTFLEALQYRIDMNLTTWIVVSPNQDLHTLQAYSPELLSLMEECGFEELVLEGSGTDRDGDGTATQSFKANKSKPTNVGGLMTFGDDSDNDEGTVSLLEEE